MKASARIFACALAAVLAGSLQAADPPAAATAAKPPVRFAIVGLTHDHAAGFIPSTRGRDDIQLAGIVETNAALVARYAQRYGLATNWFFPSLAELLAHTNIQAVATFTSTFEHRRVVEECALRKLDVMMEKPLAVNNEHARAIAAAAARGGIQVIVNYETTWYTANHAAYAMVHDQQAVGELRKVVIHDGHQGPKEIGCSPDFLNWLTDPVLNGGGALNDFGCYGADLLTWLMDGRRPDAVFAVTQHIKPGVYPKVEDEATIIVTYPRAQGIIQASWNWPFSRKDMEIYGEKGYVLVPTAEQLRVRLPKTAETEVIPARLTAPHADPLGYLAAVVRREIAPSGLSSLAVNLTVVEILEAAHESARTGRRIDLP